VRLAPSILAGDLADLKGELAAIALSGADMVHFDVMDGHFVPNLTFGAPLIRSARAYSTLPFDAHLMVTEPGAYMDSLAAAGVAQVSFHTEAERYSPRLIRRVTELGMAAGIAVNPQTPLSAVAEVLPLASFVLVMSVDPGFAGQEFIPPVWDKLDALAEWRAAQALAFSIEVDGGVTLDNLARLGAMGVDLVVAGKAFFSAPDRSAFAEAVHRAAP